MVEPPKPMPEKTAAVTPAPRRVPIVATWGRAAASAALLGALFVAAINAYVTLSHGRRTLASLAWLIAVVCVSGGALVVAILRAEEVRLVRELRTARTGTSLIRGLVARGRHQVPILGRIFSTQIGVTAVLLADGDRAGAMAALATTSPLMQGGRIERLRAIVDADVVRASGGPSSLEHAIASLRAMRPLDHREADLYRVHVRVKAILEHGDCDEAVVLASELSRSEDDEVRIYATWLRVWFDLDSEGDEDVWPPLTEGTARRATLLARAQGAARLVDKLEERLLAIARPERQE